MRDLIGILVAAAAVVASYLVVAALFAALVGLGQLASLNAGSAYLLVVAGLPFLFGAINSLAERSRLAKGRLVAISPSAGDRRRESGRAA